MLNIKHLIALKEAAGELDKLGQIDLADELTDLMYKLAFPKDLTKEEKKYLLEAEEAVHGTYNPDKSKAQSGKFYGTMTEIFRAKVKKHLGYDPFKKRNKKKKKDKKNDANKSK